MIFRKKPKLYTKCNELPLHNFNGIVFGDDLTFLQKYMDRKVNPELLQEVWLGILDEFITISNNTVALSILDKKKKLILLDKRLQVLLAIKINIQHGNDVTTTCKDYKVKPERIDSYIALVRNDINRIQNRLPNAETSGEGVKKKSISEIDKSIAMILRHGFHINRFTTMVSEWCAILNIIENQKIK